MSASVQRWWSCAEGFMQLFDAVRCLQIQFISLGVPEERAVHCLRYGPEPPIVPTHASDNELIFPVVLNMQCPVLVPALWLGSQTIISGVLSGWILSMQLEVEALPEEEREAAHEKIWQHLQSGLRPSGQASNDRLLLKPISFRSRLLWSWASCVSLRFGAASADELSVLSKTSDPSSCLWMWVGSLIGCLSMDGLIPPMVIITYAKTRNHCEPA
eukprot:4176360-Amphidinium_carterae.2